MTFILTFIILSIINVIFSTVRSIATIKSGKTIASLLSGGYFAFYNVMVIYTVANFPMWQKCLITFVCNVLGVYIVKLLEEKMRKDKLWKIELTVKPENAQALEQAFTTCEIPFNYININKYVIFNVFCETQSQSAFVNKMATRYNAKCFASETKIL